MLYMKLMDTRSLNQVIKTNTDYEPQLKTIKINGHSQGCSGFVKNPRNNHWAYLTTDIMPQEVLLRSAKDNHDYTGGRNQYPRNWAEFVETLKRILEERD
jgi:hypothetical protein